MRDNGCLTARLSQYAMASRTESFFFKTSTKPQALRHDRRTDPLTRTSPSIGICPNQFVTEKRDVLSTNPEQGASGDKALITIENETLEGLVLPRSWQLDRVGVVPMAIPFWFQVEAIMRARSSNILISAGCEIPSPKPAHRTEQGVEGSS